ncbi:MAG: dockerin type I domain-containing protein [Bacteroidia bacterium]
MQGTTIGATLDATPNCITAPTEPGVWYSFIGNGDRFAISTCTADYDTRVSVYTGSCGNLSCLTGNDDFCGLQSLTLIRSLPNQFYYVLVHGANGETGNFTLELACESSPANDNCTNASPLTCGVAAIGTTQGATLDTSPVCGGMAQTSPGVWYSFTGNGDVASLSTCGFLSNFDTRISVFTGGCSGLNCVIENDDEACLFGSRLSALNFLTNNGEQYLVLVHGFGGQTGNFILNLDCAPLPAVPANDLAVNAQTIGCLDSVGGTTIGATADVVPACGMLAGAPGVWYEFFGTGDEVTASTCDDDTDFDTQIGVYRDVGGQLECVTGNDDDLTCIHSPEASTVKFFTNFNQRYLILVQGFNGQTGNFALTTSCVSTGPVLVEECQLAEFDPGNNLSFMIFLSGTPGLSPDYLPIGGSGRILRYSDGTAEIQGTVVNRFDLNAIWDIHMFLEDQQTWAQWSAAGGLYKGGRSEALTNHPDWAYYKLTSGSYLSGQNNFANDTLWLQHTPATFTYGFQLGTGANDRNGLAGLSGWFTFSGAYTGHGDLNAAYTACQRFKRARIKLQLEGPQVANGMRTSLGTSGLLPMSQPFASSLNYQGTESVSSLPANVSDWVLVELRNPNDPTQVIARRAALLRNDGQLLSTDGSEEIKFELPGEAELAVNQAYIVVRHPSHLAVMSASAISLDQEVMSWDASKSPASHWDGSALTKTAHGLYQVPVGDVNQNGTVDSWEANMVRNQLFQQGHLIYDLNGDGEVNASDMRILLKNSGKHISIP